MIETNNSQDNSQSASDKSIKDSSLKTKVRFNKYLFIIVILSAMLISVGYGVFHFYVENKQALANQKIEMSQLSKQLERVSEEQAKKSKVLTKGVENNLLLVNDKLKKIASENEVNKSAVQALQRSLAATYIRQPNDWILSEVDYLVKLAGRKIWLEQDVKTAVALLVAADQRIVEVNDYSLSGLRRALLEDINMLSSLPEYNPDSVILKLSSLERRVDGLKTDSVSMPESKNNLKSDLSHNLNDWQENVSKSWAAFLDDFVVINKRDQRVDALLLPEQVWYLKANLRSELAKAEFAIYREQQEIYDISMQDMKILLNTYFVANDPATKSFKNAINRLSKRKVKVDYPDQLKVTPLLKRVMQLRVEKALKPQLTTQQK